MYAWDSISMFVTEEENENRKASESTVVGRGKGKDKESSAENKRDKRGMIRSHQRRKMEVIWRRRSPRWLKRGEFERKGVFSGKHWVNGRERESSVANNGCMGKENEPSAAKNGPEQSHKKGYDGKYEDDVNYKSDIDNNYISDIDSDSSDRYSPVVSVDEYIQGRSVEFVNFNHDLFQNVLRDMLGESIHTMPNRILFIYYAHMHFTLNAFRQFGDYQRDERVTVTFHTQYVAEERDCGSLGFSPPAVQMTVQERVPVVIIALHHLHPSVSFKRTLKRCLIGRLSEFWFTTLFKRRNLFVFVG